MSLYKNPYKVVPCRYFDESGKSIKPCSQGDRCRFIHPNDPEWKGPRIAANAFQSDRRPTGPRRTSSTYTAPKLKTTVSKLPSSITNHHPSPLVSQADLFQKCKVEANGDISFRGGDKLQYRDRSQMSFGDYGNLTRSQDVSPIRQVTSRPYDRQSYLGVQNPKNRFEPDQKGKVKSSRWGPRGNDRDLQSNGVDHDPEYGAMDDMPDQNLPIASEVAESTIGHLAMPKTGRVLSTPKVSDTTPSKTAVEQSRVDKLVELFRHLAHLSNEAVQAAAAQDRDEKKVQTYTEISSTLSNISSTAATTVAGTLASVLFNHAQSKERAENNFKALGDLWQKVFDIFITEIVNVIDAKQEDALKKVRSEGERAIKNIVSTLDGSVKRKVSCVSAAESIQEGVSRKIKEEKRGRSRGQTEERPVNTSSRRGSRENKRRRLASHPHDARNSGQLQQPRSNVIDLDSRIMDILEEMKSKIDRQALSVQHLTKENKLLQATSTAQNEQSATPLSTSCSSPGVSHPHQRTRTAGRTEASSILSVGPWCDRFNYARSSPRD